MSFATDIIRTLANKFRIGSFLIKEASQGLAIRNAADSENADLVCDELVVTGSTASDRAVRIQRSLSGNATNYVLVLPPNSGNTGDIVAISAPGTLIFKAISINDLPVISYQKGGTGLSVLGNPGESLRVKSDGSGFEFYTPSTGEEEEENVLNEVLFKDNNWGLYEFASQNYFWRSRDAQYFGNGGESATGAIEFGYLKLRNSLRLALGGGGSTNGNLKRVKIIRISDNVVLADNTLNSLISIDTNGIVFCDINTASFNGTKVKLRLEDNDAGGAWSWIQIDPKSCFVVV